MWSGTPNPPPNRRAAKRVIPCIMALASSQGILPRPSVSANPQLLAVRVIECYHRAETSSVFFGVPGDVWQRLWLAVGAGHAGKDVLY